MVDAMEDGMELPTLDAGVSSGCWGAGRRVLPARRSRLPRAPPHAPQPAPRACCVLFLNALPQVRVDNATGAAWVFAGANWAAIVGPDLRINGTKIGGQRRGGGSAGGGVGGEHAGEQQPLGGGRRGASCTGSPPVPHTPPACLAPCRPAVVHKIDADLTLPGAPTPAPAPTLAPLPSSGGWQPATASAAALAAGLLAAAIALV